MSHKSGLTLVDTMILTAIIGLVAAIGIPSALNAKKQAEEKEKASNVAAQQSKWDKERLPPITESVLPARYHVVLHTGSVPRGCDAYEKPVFSNGVWYVTQTTGIKVMLSGVVEVEELRPQ